MCPLGPVRFYSGWQEWGAFLSNSAAEFLVNHSWVGNSNQPAAGPECSVEELYPAAEQEGGEEWMEGKTAHHSTFVSLTYSLSPILWLYISKQCANNNKKVFKLFELSGTGTFTHQSHKRSGNEKAKNTLQDVSLSSTETMTSPSTYFMIFWNLATKYKLSTKTTALDKQNMQL